MLIFTGMDNSGKTTLVNKVSKDLGLPVVKSMGPDHTKDEKHIWFLDQMTREKTFPGSVLFDRFLPFEEMVYGKILRGDAIYSLDDPYMKTLKDLNPTIVYTRPHSSVIFNWDGREQMMGVIEKDKELLAAWDDLMWGLMARGWNVQVYDYKAEQEQEAEEEAHKMTECLHGLMNHLYPPLPRTDGKPIEWRKGCSCCCDNDDEED